MKTKNQFFAKTLIAVIAIACFAMNVEAKDGRLKSDTSKMKMEKKMDKKMSKKKMSKMKKDTASKM
jgi:hypothetical protein